MSKHYASASWEDNLVRGKGTFTLKTSGYSGKVTFPSRFEDNKEASSPEELIGAAHATCFSMAFAHALDQAGYTPQNIETQAEVTLEKTSGGFSVTGILLQTRAKVNDIPEEDFHRIANDAKENCPVSRALKAVNIQLKASMM